MKVKVTALLQPEVIAALWAGGYNIVKVGECPPWMERVESLPAPLYRMRED